MASKIKEKILDELLEMRNLTDSETKQGLLDGLADRIDKLDDDRDIRNLIWANRDLPLRMFTGDDFSVMPSVGEIMTSNPPSDTINYEKEFGKDWKYNFGNIPVSKIQFLADKNGLDWLQVLDDMSEQVGAQSREDIAHGRWDPNQSLKENIKGEIAGALLTAFGRRQQEAIARGEDPQVRDYAGDILENGMYAIPWARGLGAIAKGGRVARVLTGPGAQYVMGNATAPVVSEAYDANVYDEDNPRGSFNPTDVIAGVGTNLAAPVVLQRMTMGAGRYIPVIKHLNGGGQIVAKSQEQIAKEMAKTHTPMSASQGAKTRIERMIEAGKQPSEQMYARADMFTNEADKKVYDALLKKIRNGEPLTQGERKYALSGSHPELVDYYNLKYKPSTVPTERSLMAEESIKNLATNEYGEKDANQTLYHRIPFVGAMIANKVKEDEEEDKERKRREEIERKWKFRLGDE